MTKKDQSLNISFIFTMCITQAKLLKLSISSSVKEGCPNPRVAGGSSEIMHVKCSAQCLTHRNGILPNFTVLQLCDWGAVTIVSVFQMRKLRLSEAKCLVQRTQASLYQSTYPRVSIPAKRNKRKFTWWGEIHRHGGAVLIHICIGDIMGPNKIECIQLYRKTNVEKHPLKGKARKPWVAAMQKWSTFVLRFSFIISFLNLLQKLVSSQCLFREWTPHNFSV